ncbi:MAG: GNAT family N-acetyltransferase [Leptolyngbya sp. SIOISBB]|nr:GNAT family N-acetyltransferase [Leptolyngbya sp. SIOISBB]
MLALQSITPAVADSFREVRLRALQDAPAAFCSTYAQEARLTPDDWQRRANQWTSEQAIAYLALDGQTAQAIAASIIDPDNSARAYLRSMWVAPPYRTCGVGKQLVEAIAEWATAKQASSLYLDVTSNNEAAIAFYHRLGFVKTGHTEPYPNNAKLTVYEMVRQLACRTD